MVISIVTVFLLVLIFALILGNVLLSFINPRPKEEEAESAEDAGIEQGQSLLAGRDEEAGEEECPEGNETEDAEAGQLESPEDAEESQGGKPVRLTAGRPGGEESAYEKFINMIRGRRAAQEDEDAERGGLTEGAEGQQELNQRIDRLERILLGMNNNSFVGKKLNGTALKRKLNDLSDFRNDTKIQIAALRDELEQLKRGAARAKKGKENAPEIKGRALHELAYNIKKKR